MRYTANYFKKDLPEWKYKKDPILLRYAYRPFSFYLTALAANIGFSANTVSYISTVIGVFGCILFLSNNKKIIILAAILINVWLLLDCVDGNLARSIKKQPFGDFADAMSSYVLVGLISTFMGVAVYRNGGFFIGSRKAWIILIGALASESDTLMRLIYQKYKNVETEWKKNNILYFENDIRTDHKQVGSLRVRIEMEMGIAGLLPPAIFLGAVFNALDIVVFYCFAYYGLSCLATIVLYIRKTIIEVREFEKDTPNNFL